MKKTTWTTACPLVAAAALAGCSDQPSETITQKEAALVSYESCEALEAGLKEMLAAETRARFDQWRHWEEMGWPVLAGAEDADASPPSGERQEGTDFSGTNNQEAGVDEADFVKTDGYHVYVLNGNRFHVFGVPEFGNLVPEAVVEVEGTPHQMLVNRDAGRAVIFSQVDPTTLPVEHPLHAELGRYDDGGVWWWRTDLITKATVLDVSVATAPSLLREVYLEGWYQTARMVGSSVRMGAYSWLNIPGLYYWWWGDTSDLDAREAEALRLIDELELDDLVPRIYERLPDRTFAAHSLAAGDCSSFAHPTDSEGRGIASILSVDVASDELALDADHIVANWPTFYASHNRLYLAESAHDWWWFWWNPQDEQLNIHAFDISTPGETAYLGSGRVDGALHNQFSMGEHDGYLRVATTVNRWNRWWEESPPPPDNRVYVLSLDAGALTIAGEVAGIAEGERIFAARFVGERGYLVTFRNIDPLFTLDLSDPSTPRVVGELEVPGFSTYIHPIADDRLLTIGVGGDEMGADWRAQVSLFNVSDFAAPGLVDVEPLLVDGEWGWSEAMYEHKAFQYWAPRGLLAVPMSSYGYAMREDGYADYHYTSRLELIRVDPATGLSRHGAIDHSTFFNSDPETYWYYRDVRRSIFMGDFIYAISDRGITVNRTDDLAPVTEQPLPGWSPDDLYWWW